MRVTISKWGDSLALRLPQAMVHDAGLASGAVVELEMRNGALVMKPMKKRENLSDLIASASDSRMAADYYWGKPEAGEAW